MAQFSPMRGLEGKASLRVRRPRDRLMRILRESFLFMSHPAYSPEHK